MLISVIAAAALLSTAAGAAPKRPIEASRVARWLISNTNWGSIATISMGHEHQPVGTPFANPQSFSDGIANSTDPKKQSTGVPYFFMTGLDETPQDLAANPNASFAVTEAQITGDATCAKTDTEDPTCARIVLTGQFVDVTKTGTPEENQFALQALYSKHPSMKGWGAPGAGDHAFHIWKLHIESIFFLDFYGGSKPLTPQKYLAASP